MTNKITHKTVDGTLELSKPDDRNEDAWRRDVEKMLTMLLTTYGVEPNEEAAGLVKIEFVPDYVRKRQYPALYRHTTPYLVEFVYEHYRDPQVRLKYNSDHMEYIGRDDSSTEAGPIIFGLVILVALFFIGFAVGMAA